MVPNLTQYKASFNGCHLQPSPTKIHSQGIRGQVLELVEDQESESGCQWAVFTMDTGEKPCPPRICPGVL